MAWQDQAAKIAYKTLVRGGCAISLMAFVMIVVTFCALPFFVF